MESENHERLGQLWAFAKKCDERTTANEREEGMHNMKSIKLTKDEKEQDEQRE